MSNENKENFDWSHFDCQPTPRNPFSDLES
jgi:hypothetical protein